MKSLILGLALVGLTALSQTNVPALLVARKPSADDYKAWNERARLERERTTVFMQSTNTATLAELTAKGVDIRFREVAFVDYDKSGQPVLRRRWVMCSEPFGETLNDWATK